MKEALLLLCLGVISLALLGYPATANGRVEVNIVLPPLVVAAPPEVVVIPGTYVYFAPGIEVDFFFYHGYWYRPYRGYWYRATGYNGPWVYIAPSRVPRPLLSLPPDFRRIPPGHQRIPYGQLKKNWRTWERQKHWDKHDDRDRDRGGPGDRDKDRGRGDHGGGEGKGRGR